MKIEATAPFRIVPVFTAVAFAIVGTSNLSVAQNEASIPQPAPRIATGSWAAALKEHPRLLGPRAHLQNLAKAKPEVYKMIRTQGFLQAVAITHAVEGVGTDRMQPFIRRAMEYVVRGATDVHQDTWIALGHVAQTYDLFFNAISPEDRARMIEWMNAHLGKYRTDENAFHNSTLSKILCYLQIAYAT